jgi:hypothetical protein
MARIVERLRAGDPLLLDGGTGSELQRRGVDVLLGSTGRLKAWSATANLAAGDVVRQVHQDYLRVGADIITSNNFWTSPSRLATLDAGDDWRTCAEAAACKERAPMPDVPTLARCFGDAGYQAVAVGKLHVYPPARPDRVRRSDNQRGGTPPVRHERRRLGARAGRARLRRLGACRRSVQQRLQHEGVASSGAAPPYQLGGSGDVPRHPPARSSERTMPRRKAAPGSVL